MAIADRSTRGRSRRVSTAALTLLGGLLLLSGCAGTPLQSRAVDDARARYLAASENPRIREAAAGSMDRAGQHLAEAERLLRESGRQADVDHHAFLSRQHVAIAEARLRRAGAQQDLQRAEERRRSLLAEARRLEAAAAARRADTVEDQLAETRMQLRLAEERARALADRLVEAGVTGSREPD